MTVLLSGTGWYSRDSPQALLCFKLHVAAGSIVVQVRSRGVPRAREGRHEGYEREAARRGQKGGTSEYCRKGLAKGLLVEVLCAADPAHEWHLDAGGSGGFQRQATAAMQCMSMPSGRCQTVPQMMASKLLSPPRSSADASKGEVASFCEASGQQPVISVI